MPKLGVNIDHVATVRQARKTFEPDPVWAAAVAQLGGAETITVHLREDRRHIQDRDAQILKQTVSCKLNLECACVESMIDLACRLRPDQVCLVPERRQELTTEGGLDLRQNGERMRRSVDKLHNHGIEVSAFIDPDPDQIRAAVDIDAESVELHTGQYARTRGSEQLEELAKLKSAAERVLSAKLNLHAGHGLTYDNVQPVARIEGMQELNIGHSIVARSIMVGMRDAVREMKRLISSD